MVFRQGSPSVTIIDVRFLQFGLGSPSHCIRSFPPTTVDASDFEALPSTLMNKKRIPTTFSPHLKTSTISSRQIDNAWTVDEHQRFLLALEQFGENPCSSVGETWRSIAAAVGTRDISQVVYHARLYFAQLQQLNARKCQERQLRQNLDDGWAPEEDAMFEDMLAAFSTSSVCYPWKVMASHLPGKSPLDLKKRYQKLCYDVARIEGGQNVTMHPGFKLATRAAAIGESRRLASQMVLDSAIILTPAEEKLLASAMADAFVSVEAPANVLDGIASAVAAFTSSNGRIPPQRTHPIFTKEQALKVLNNLLKDRQTNPQVVLETLAVQLRLHPQALNVSAGVSFSSSATESSDPNLHLLASTGLTFGTMLPSPLGAEFGMPFESTPRFSNNVGLLSPSLRPPQSMASSNSAPLLARNGLQES